MFLVQLGPLGNPKGPYTPVLYKTDPLQIRGVWLGDLEGSETQLRWTSRGSETEHDCNMVFIRVPQKECGKRSSITFFRFRDAFGHFLVTFSDASVTFLRRFFAKLLLRQGEFGKKYALQILGVREIVFRNLLGRVLLRLLRVSELTTSGPIARNQI